ncbi:hypothetical protein KKD04_03260 [Patescibacteria group bacterium]|nr:hypothetical protein [Patescibacteria group bacterium]
MTNITIQIPKQEKNRLSRLAIQYGFSLQEFLTRIVQEISSEIPGESWNEYLDHKKLQQSFIKAIKDYKNGHFYKMI